MTPRDQLDDVAQQLDESNHQYWTVLQVSSWAYKQLQKHQHRGENYMMNEHQYCKIMIVKMNTCNNVRCTMQF